MRWIKRSLLFCLGVSCGVAVAIFMASNLDPVTVHWPWPEPGAWVMPLWVLVLVTFAIGVLVPLLLATAAGVERFFDRRRLVRRIHDLEQELVELRNLPLTEARIDLERPAPRIRPIVDAPREVEVEVEVVGAGEDIREADLYPAVYDTKREA